MGDLHLVITTRYATNDNLLPCAEIRSEDVPFDYAIMTPDYQWHYYAPINTEYGKRFKAVTMTGEDLS